MNLLLALLLLQPPPGLRPIIVIPNSPDAAVYPGNVRMTVSATCPQGTVRIVAQLFPTRAGPRIREVRVGGRRLPRTQLALIDRAIGGALIDTIHVWQCVNPPDRRIHVRIRVERSTGPIESVTESVVFFIEGDRIVVTP